jgi:hypothetical protein
MNRKVVEKEALEFIDMFLPGSDNREVTKQVFARMSDGEFDEWIEELANKTKYLTLYAPNLAEVTLSMERHYAIAEKLGFELFQQLKLTDRATGQVIITPNKHLIGMLPVRRQVQMLAKKRSIPGSSHVVDQRSGQVSGGSKGSRLSGPEIQVNVSKGLKAPILELIKFRAGDATSFNAMNRQILETGHCSLSTIMVENPGFVKSNKTLSIYLSAALLKNNLAS